MLEYAKLFLLFNHIVLTTIEMISQADTLMKHYHV